MILVTTNYDVWLDEPLAATGPRRYTNGTTSAPHNRTYERRAQARALLSQPDTVIHLHDLVRDPAMIILTTSDYINDYAAHNLSSHDSNNRKPRPHIPAIYFFQKLSGSGKRRRRKVDPEDQVGTWQIRAGPNPSGSIAGWRVRYMRRRRTGFPLTAVLIPAVPVRFRVN